MTEKPAPKKGNEMVRAVIDLLILMLLLIGAGFGGYYWGVHQRLAPVQTVAPGTPGAIPPASASLPPPKSDTPGSAAPSSTTTPSSTAALSSIAASTGDPAQPGHTATSKPAATESSSTAGKHSKMKYWLSSDGTDYIGYNITVNVNGQPVDSFFAPGKNVDITRLVKEGDNTITFDAKAMGEQYNKHMGDASAVLTLNLVKGPYVQENFKKSDILLSFSRSAVDTDDANQALHFTRE